MGRKGKEEVTLNSYTPNWEECRYVIFRVIEQSIKDYMNLESPKNDEEKFNWESAKEFLFHDDYFIQWGDHELRSVDLMEMVDIEPEWLRDKVSQKLHPVLTPDGVISTRRSKQ